MVTARGLGRPDGVEGLPDFELAADLALGPGPGRECFDFFAATGPMSLTTRSRCPATSDEPADLFHALRSCAVTS